MRTLYRACILTALAVVGYYTILFLHAEKSVWRRYFSSENRVVVDKRNVYFLETSGRGTLDLRQLAVVESAARFISNCSVRVLLFTPEELVVTRAMEDVRKTYDVRFMRKSMWVLTTGTPLQDWFRKEEWKKSPHRVAHLSDAFRLLVLWLHGGLYLDLDVLLIQPWTSPANAVVYEDDQLCNSVLMFERRSPFLLDCLRELSAHYDPSQWSFNGPALIRRVMSRPQHRNYTNIRKLPRHYFFEIRWYEGQKFLAEEYLDEVMNRTAHSYGVHLWNQMTLDRPVSPSSDCAYMRMVKKSSPVVHRHMRFTQYV